MKKSLTGLCAIVLAAGLAACGGGGDNASDAARLNASAAQLDDNGVYDTSADDAALNEAELQEDDGAPGNAAGGNGGAPANGSAGNAQ